MTKKYFGGIIMLALAILACVLPNGAFSKNPTTDMQVAGLLYVLSLGTAILLLVVEHNRAQRRDYPKAKAPIACIVLALVLGLTSCEPHFSKGLTKSGLVVHLDLSQVEHEYQPGEPVVTHQHGLLYIAQPWAQTSLKHTYLTRGQVDTLTVLEVN